MVEEVERVEVVLRTISGEQLATLRLQSQEAVSKVKDLVQEEFGYPPHAQNLLLEGTMAEDDGLVGGLPQPLIFSLVRLPFDKGWSLHYAAQSGHEAAARNLLFRVACDGQETSDLLFLATGKDDQQLTALHRAAGKGHAAVCRALIAAAPDREVTSRILVARDGPFHQTALHRAAKQGHGTVCRALLESAPTVEVQTEMLMAEALGRRGPFAADAGGLTAGAGGLTALHLAAVAGHEMVLRALLESTPSPEVQTLMLLAGDLLRSTALHKAASRGQEIACRVLLGLSPDMEVQRRMLMARECTAKTALHLAAFAGHDMTCRALLESTPDVEVQRELLAAKDNSDDTALSWAAFMNSEVVCRVLLESAPDVGVQREMLGDALSHPAPLAGINRARQTLLDFAARLEPQDLAQNGLQLVGGGHMSCLLNDRGWVMRYLAVDEPSRKTIAARNGIEAVLRAMRKNLAAADLQGYCCGTLTHLAVTASNRVAIMSLKGIQAVLKAMKHHLGSTLVQYKACAAIANIASTQKEQTAVAELGGAKVIVDVLRAHPSDAAVQGHCIGALNNLAQHTESRKLIASFGGLEVLKNALQRHRGESELQRVGSKLVALLRAAQATTMGGE